MESGFQSEGVIFDREGVLKRLMGDKDLLEVVLESFFADIPGRIEELQQAVGKMDSENIVLISHVIKGAAGNVGAVSVSDIARHMEDNARKGVIDNIENLFQKLRSEYTLFVKEVKNQK